MSQPRLAGMPAPPEDGFPPYAGRAHAARGVATEMAHVARCLEAAAAGATVPPWLPVPELSDFAAGDQVAVAGHDLVDPGADVWIAELGRGPAIGAVERSHRMLADLRRRL